MCTAMVPMEIDELADDVFSNTPLCTPSSNLHRPALFFQSPKFRELLKDRHGKKCSCSQHPAVKKLSSGNHYKHGFMSPRLAGICKKRSPPSGRKHSPYFVKRNSVFAPSVVRNSPQFITRLQNSPVLTSTNRNSPLILAEMGKSSPILAEMIKNSPLFNLKEKLTPTTPNSGKKLNTPKLDILAKSSSYKMNKNSPRMNILSKKSPRKVTEVLNLPSSTMKRASSEEPEDPRSIKLTRLLGSGGFGSVYKGELHGHKVAVKKFHGTTNNLKARLQSFRAESNVIHLQHPNVVSVLASYCENCYDDSYIVMEYAGHLNLQKLINETGGPLGLKRRLSYSLDVAKALEYIHDKCVVHLDVKPSNIIISPNDVCRLADFGCCQMVEEDTGHVSPINRSYLTGTVAYRAPELLRGEPPCRKADIYSIAITLWQMVTGDMPFTGINPHVIIFGVVAQNLRPPVPTNINCEDAIEMCYQNLYKQCWAAARLGRPTAKYMVNVLSNWLQHLFHT